MKQVTQDSRLDARYDAHYFDAELHRDHWFTNNAAKRARRWREVLRMLEPRPSDRILEVGCGAGEHALRLGRLVGQVVGVDRSLAGVQRACARAKREHASNAAFAVCDAASLPLSDEAFDKAAAIDFVEHVTDDVLGPAFGELKRVLKPGGVLAIYTPCATHYVERLKARNFLLRQLPGHIAVRRPQDYVSLLRQAGLAVRAQWFSPSDYPVAGALDRMLAPLPVAGSLFRFRICMVAVKALA
jgi:ubiquinone/menaquinone biosynthesis C-methylase UbiE